MLLQEGRCSACECRCHLQVQLLAEVVDAWLTSLDRQEGLFCQHDIPSLSDTEVGDPTAETPGDTWTVTDGQTLTQAVSDEGSLPSLLAQHVRAQAVWLHFFWELWQVFAGVLLLQLHSLPAAGMSA